LHGQAGSWGKDWHLQDSQMTGLGTGTVHKLKRQIEAGSRDRPSAS
jgi:hypothetical protein